MSSRKRSIAWSFFNKSPGKSTLARCNLCGTGVAHTNTSNLLEHLRSKHRGDTTSLWDSDDFLPVKRRQKRNECSTAIKLETSSTRKCRSVVWMCFEKSNENDTNSAVCTLCGKSIRQLCGSTSNLLKHLLNKHPIEYESIASDRSLTISCESVPLETELEPTETMKRRSRSILWGYFVKNSENASEVECSFCGKILKQPVGSTSNLIKHLFAKHRKEYRKLYPEDENMVVDGSDDIPSAEVIKKEISEVDSTVTQMRFVAAYPPVVESELEDKEREEDEEEEEEDSTDVSSNSSIPEMFTKVRSIWVRHCSEREQEFNHLILKRRKEILTINESMQKLREQMALLTNDVRQLESKRKAELGRQEKMDVQFLTRKEATSRKLKYSKNFKKMCSLIEDVLEKSSNQNSACTTLKFHTTEIMNTAGCAETEENALKTNHEIIASATRTDVSSRVFPNNGHEMDNNLLVILPLDEMEMDRWTCGGTAISSKTDMETEDQQWTGLCLQ